MRGKIFANRSIADITLMPKREKFTSSSVSYVSPPKQSYNILINYNHPEHYDFNVEKGQTLTINSTLPYLTLMFTSYPPCQIKAFKSTRKYNVLKEYTDFVFDNSFAGIDFGYDVGHFQMKFEKEGKILFDSFAFPPSCSKSRMIVHYPNYKFILSSVISQTDFWSNNNTLCIFPSGGDPFIKLPNNIPIDPFILTKCGTEKCERVRSYEPKSLKQSYLILAAPNPFYSYIYSFDIQQYNYLSTYQSVKIVGHKPTIIGKQKPVVHTPTPTPKPQYENPKSYTGIYLAAGIAIICLTCLVVIHFIGQGAENHDEDERQLVPRAMSL